MFPFLFIFVQSHDEFRIPELQSIAEMNGFTFNLSSNDIDRDPSRPFMLIDLACELHARKLAERCTLIRSVYEFYARGSTYEELHAKNVASRELWAHYIPDTSFKFQIVTHNHKITQKYQKDVIESFNYMGLLGKIDMKNPERVFGCFEEYNISRNVPRSEQEPPTLQHVFFGRLLYEGTARTLAARFDVKKRSYFGNTSMEAEMSLLMANQAMATLGRIIYDPFVGTGSMLYTTAFFGASVFGSDIDGRQMRGKEARPGIFRAAAQYGVEPRILDLCTFDVTNNPWRCGGIFDAIVTDPPYGVRAGAKRLGRKELKGKQRPYVPRTDDTQPYIPPTQPYELSALARDLVALARHLLRPSGRLVFFLPTVNEEYEEVDIEIMLCDGMEVVANSLQDFGSWGRRLVTIRKTSFEDYPMPSFRNIDEAAKHGRDPAHKHFRDKYFQRFGKTH